MRDFEYFGYLLMLLGAALVIGPLIADALLKRNGWM